MVIDYEFTTDFNVIDKVRARYTAEMVTLQRLGFTELCFYSEIIFPFSAMIMFPVWWMMRQHREICQLRRPLRISASYPLLVSSSLATTVLITGLGVKFYTLFADNSGLITANFNSSSGQDLDGTFVKYATPGSIEEVWQKHRTRLTELQALGKQIRVTTTFEDYVILSKREDYMAADTVQHQMKGEATHPAPDGTRTLLLALFLLGAVGLILLFLLILAKKPS